MHFGYSRLLQILAWHPFYGEYSERVERVFKLLSNLHWVLGFLLNKILAIKWIPFHTEFWIFHGYPLIQSAFLLCNFQLTFETRFSVSAVTRAIKTFSHFPLFIICIKKGGIGICLGQAVWYRRQNALLRQSSLKGPQHLFVSYHNIINVMPKITSQIFWFTKYWLLLALDLFLLLSLSCY